MHGELINVWSETRREIWDPLLDQPIAGYEDGVPIDVFCDLYRVLAPVLKSKPTIEDLADALDDPIQSREGFGKTSAEDIIGEPALVGFFESVHDALVEFGGDDLSNRYFNLLARFIDKYSLRYDLRRPCVLCPTLPGVFTSLVRELDLLGSADANIGKRLRDFRECIQDLRYGPTEGRIANCVMKQVMFLEAVAAASGGGSGSDLAALCKAVDHWPHPAVRQSLLNLYGFASDFPGVRHGTPSTGMKREIDMRDMVAMCILLTGFTLYLEDSLNATTIFGGIDYPGPTSAAATIVDFGSSGKNVFERLWRRLALWSRRR